MVQHHECRLLIRVLPDLVYLFNCKNEEGRNNDSAMVMVVFYALSFACNSH
jgi:hypothetical protein